MDRFSFLNAAHAEFFAQLYDEYLENPDTIEPSWRSFFQGFDFAVSNYGSGPLGEQIAAYADTQDCSVISDKLQKEFNVLKLIEGYRTRGHLFTKTNPVRERRVFSPTLDLANFGLSDADLDTVFDAAQAMKLQPCTLRDILGHLQNIYCRSIGVEYMYIRKPEVIQWIQDKIGYNDNYPKLNEDQRR